MYDLAVIGLGPAGLEAVQIAIKNGLKVIAFEKGELGGTCLNVGCIPTKTVLHSANVYNEFKNASKIGLNVFSMPNYNWQAILDRKIEIVNKFTKVLDVTLSKKITLIRAEAELFINYDNIEIYADDNVYQAKNIIIATGSKPIELPNLEFDGKFIVSSDDMFKMDGIPKKITIVGSGAIGLEWAQILSNLGSEVKIIEKAPELAFNLDIELQKRVERFLKLNKIQYFKNDFIVKVSDTQVILNSGVAFDTDCILVAAGRKPNVCRALINGCKEEFQIKPFEDGSCEIDNLYIVGDALGKTMLAHAASYQARCIMNKILFNKEIKQKPIPSVIYTTIPMASVGIREQDIDLTDGYEVKKVLIPSLAKSWCDGANDGAVKIIIKDDCIVGAHVVSKEADSLIAIFNILIDRKVKLDEIEDMIFPHPSFCEIVQEVVKSE